MRFEDFSTGFMVPPLSASRFLMGYEK